MTARLTILAALLFATTASAGPRSIVVRFTDSGAALAERVDKGAELVRRFDFIEAEQWDVEGDRLAVCEDLLRNPAVVYAEPDRFVQLQAVPNDSAFASQWCHDNQGTVFPYIPDVDMDSPEAWDIATDCSSVIVGIVDTGAMYDHPDLAANVWTNPGEIPGNSVDDDGNGFVDDVHGYDFAYNDGDPSDGYGHGTHVAGIVAALGNNSIGVAGVCWSAKLMILKFFDDTGGGYITNAFAAYQYAIAMGAKITNNSWITQGLSQGTTDAVAALTAAGMLTVCSAGNNAWDMDCCPSLINQCKAYPAALTDPGVISVGSSTRGEVISGFSNYGATTVDLFAPGSDILNIFNTGGYGIKSGTSMAGPMVAGAAALLWSLNPSLNYEQVRAHILATVDVLPAYSGKCVTGGRLNLHALLSTPVGVAYTTPETILDRNFYDVQGRRVEQERSGVTFQRKGKRVTIR